MDKVYFDSSVNDKVPLEDTKEFGTYYAMEFQEYDRIQLLSLKYDRYFHQFPDSEIAAVIRLVRNDDQRLGCGDQNPMKIKVNRLRAVAAG